ncbi:MAG: hypothetical protein CEN89_18 [Candidatus Berkelbacteria bacterium Licking1014_7]|uniref:Uncharacterized protein n=1 Tax=Candidatus Berkelbacteria bacterium Licking1014_7 TaxID=2017147 RepID=A0A554LKT4_9BACT|nr:MAG: hypothetical protein CEN89_18 [Candidatus Berkelbacteria bacterium Licking1014_7]
MRRDFRRENGYIYSIEITNSNPFIIKSFSLFLEKIICADWSRIRGQLFFYPDLNEHNLIKQWSNISNIPISQFQKSICLKQKTGKFKPNPMGTFKLRYTHKNDFLKLQKMINQLWRDAGVV